MSIRTERLGGVLKRDLGEILQREYQPVGTFITVTKVLMTDDLSIARVYLSVFAPGRDEKAIYSHLDEHIDEIRHTLAGKIRHQVRKIPELHFYVDDTAEYVNKIEKLFDKVDQQPKAPTEDEED
ncbi:MAG: 30S ribosome-binding factor RbfA [Balneola sp.]|jgi:ribosome-binding factor A|uniref:30S ribosome-binding factor RbfA n=1 Tax=Balneola sp. EhC07 TaxID=1849360 RepID=UPI0007F41CE3|nr:30S ribosome-binding factor RbfA [Balneola sp. EhC07]MBO6621234.1 30S ribosome-binding factor RbfA [Balneola sp.]MBO6650094.1 30S ribosome-binding factor RbfA [Balneola sp.]MBO6710457.1 30S ribosome-binding factor RbfA [Balneola sp.]MBO6799142.1 30S ribosome-binding factor RbfA [Balneola sp.]MBO6870982.1 30S ribosome-binding factor RbfA [Balneola sp.]